jgi:hypothetical protein
MFSVMTYDSQHDRVLLFGHGGSTETWLWDGTSWGLPATAPLPPARDGQAIAYDSGRGKVVLFGGAQSMFNTPLNDTWEWNGSFWTERTVTGPVPPGGSGVQMAYDVARGRSVLLDAGSTWEWDGMNWVERAPTGPSPLVGTLAYDSARRAIVLFGGTGGSAQIWLWDGATWTEQPSATTPPRVEVIAYDSARDRIVLFNKSPATWEWDGVNWAARVRAPPVSDVPLMAYDRARREAVLFGGKRHVDMEWIRLDAKDLLRSRSGLHGSDGIRHSPRESRAVQWRDMGMGRHELGAPGAVGLVATDRNGTDLGGDDLR